MNYDRASMKLAARAAVRETRPGARGVTFVFTLISGVIPGIIMLLALLFTLFLRTLVNFVTLVLRDPMMFENDPYYALQLLGSIGGSFMIIFFISVLISLFQSVMTYGYYGWALKVWRREDPGCGTLFNGFPIAGKVIGCSIMVAIFTFLWSLIPSVVGTIINTAALRAGGDIVADIVRPIVQAVITICTTLIAYRYCLAPYFLMQDPDMGVFAAITASKTAMRGKLWKRFVLDLSFIGWGLIEGVIVYAGMFVGLIVSALIGAGSGAFEVLERLSRFNGDDLFFNFPFEEVLTVAGILVIGIFAGALVAAIVSLPFSLWLTAYQQTAAAGFFCAMTELPVPEEPLWNVEPPQPPTEPSEPQPPVPPVTPEPVPEEPAPEAPKAPEDLWAPPQIPETPTPPEAPKAPENPWAPPVPPEEPKGDGLWDPQPPQDPKGE